MNLNLKNKTVLLTGAGKGIGKKILELLIKEKSNCICRYKKQNRFQKF